MHVVKELNDIQESAPGCKEMCAQAFRPLTFSQVWVSAHLFYLRKCKYNRTQLPVGQEKKGRRETGQGVEKKEACKQRGRSNLDLMFSSHVGLSESPVLPHAYLIPPVSNCLHRYLPHSTLLIPTFSLPHSLHNLHILHTLCPEYQPQSKYLSGKMLANSISYFRYRNQGTEKL